MLLLQLLGLFLQYQLGFLFIFFLSLIILESLPELDHFSRCSPRNEELRHTQSGFGLFVVCLLLILVLGERKQLLLLFADLLLGGLDSRLCLRVRAVDYSKGEV